MQKVIVKFHGLDSFRGLLGLLRGVVEHSALLISYGAVLLGNRLPNC